MAVRCGVSGCIIALVMMEVTMGGIGSGAQRSTNVGNVEDAIALDIRVLRRLGALRPGECVIERIRWRERALRAPEALLRADLSDIERGGELSLVADMPDGTTSQQIAIDAVPSALGGHRCYFICPVTASRCEILYYLDGRFASRKAHRLTYAVQGMTDPSRARRKVAKLHARLDGSEGFRRPRCRRRIATLHKLKEAQDAARELHFDRLRSHLDRSGARRMPSVKRG